MKMCSKCKELKSYEDFYKNSSRKDGYNYICKECTQKEYRSLHGTIVSIYNRQKVNSRLRKHPKPTYSLEQLKEYLMSDKLFKELHVQWGNNDYLSEYRPTVDRINPLLPYTLSNIQVLTWKDNKDKGHKETSNGIDTRNCREIIQADLVGNELATHFSIQQAAKAVKGNRRAILNCLSGRCKSSAGYRWKYKEEK